MNVDDVLESDTNEAEEETLEKDELMELTTLAADTRMIGEVNTPSLPVTDTLPSVDAPLVLTHTESCRGADYSTNDTLSNSTDVLSVLL